MITHFQEMTQKWHQGCKILRTFLFLGIGYKMGKVLSESMCIGSWNKITKSDNTFASSSKSGLSKIIRIKPELSEFNSSEC